MVLIADQSLSADTPPPQTLFTNVNIFNGTDDKLYENHRVLVEGNTIKAISVGEIESTSHATIIDGGGRTLMPGLIDAHVHLNLQNLDNPAGIDGVNNMTWEEVGALAYHSAQEYLYSGFTTVRDLCIVILADGADEVLKACRNNLAGGADFCKMMAGGGVTSTRDPLHSLQGTPDELRAMVTADRQWDSYGAVHAYQDQSVINALEAGVLSIEHGNLMNQKSTFDLVKEKGAFVVPAMAGFSEQLLKHPYYGNPALPAYGKVKQIMENYDTWVKLANDTGIDIGYGTDVVVSSLLVSRGTRDFQMGQWAESFGNFKTLKAMTADNGRLMAFTGKNNPYPGKLGVIEKGAYADIILVDGNPLKDLKLLGASFDMWAPSRAERSIETIPFVMRDGKIYRNRL